MTKKKKEKKLRFLHFKKLVMILLRVASPRLAPPLPASSRPTRVLAPGLAPDPPVCLWTDARGACRVRPCGARRFAAVGAGLPSAPLAPTCTGRTECTCAAGGASRVYP